MFQALANEGERRRDIELAKPRARASKVKSATNFLVMGIGRYVSMAEDQIKTLDNTRAVRLAKTTIRNTQNTVDRYLEVERMRTAKTGRSGGKDYIANLSLIHI